METTKNNSNHSNGKKHFRISGMTCTSCEIVIERKLKKIPGVHKVVVNHRTEQCLIEHDASARFDTPLLQQHLEGTEYIISPVETKVNQNTDEPSLSKNQELLKTGGIVLLTFIVYKILERAGIINMSVNITSAVTYSTALILGLIASISTCMATVGGLVLGIASRTQNTPNISKINKLRPHIFFHTGRLVGYFLLGGIVGWIGSVFSLNAKTTSAITILIAVVMIMLALEMLGIIPKNKNIFKLPKFLGHKVHDLSEKNHGFMPFLLGGATFLLPCGFTQAMQLYALSTGSFWKGALIMFLFALGTFPALAGISLISSVLKGNKGKLFLKIAGSVVLVFALINLNAGFTLLGLPLTKIFATKKVASTTAIQNQNNTQIVNMRVQGINYLPSNITLKAGVPVEWHVDGTGALGCTSILVVPSLKIKQNIAGKKDAVIRFTPNKPGKISFTCGMGMAYGEFQVVTSTDANSTNKPACDPTIQNCVQ